MHSLSAWARASGHKLTSSEADRKLTEAYIATFSGHPTREDAEMVLVDMAVFSRYYEHMLPDVSTEALRHAEGRRAIMRRIVGFIADEKVLGELHVAALEEAIERSSE